MIKQNKKVLVIRCGLLGDTVDATSVIQPLIELYGSELEIPVSYTHLRAHET